MLQRVSSSCRRASARRWDGYLISLVVLLLTIIASSAQAQSACKVVYTISNQWSGGFGTAITINNTGTTAWSSWTLAWSFANGQTITQLWNGSETQSGANVTVTNLSYNGSIPAGGSYIGMGFNGTWNDSTNAIPTIFSVNGTICGNTAASGSFTLSPSPSALSITQGSTATDTISVVDAGGFSGSVSLAVSGLPSGVTATVSGDVITFAASSTATAGAATVNVTGTSGSLSASTTIDLTVDAVTSASLPCDIYASAGTPCVAAHSTTRALFGDYDGDLYQIQRASDDTTLNIGVLSTGGYANAAAQNTFCANTSCTIIRLYDQTTRHNDLTVEGAGGNGAADRPAIANSLPVMAGGHQVYGLFISAGMGYRNDITNGVATGSEPEGLYMVTSGTHFNGGCCFDYGNAETNNQAGGDGFMNAINFGNECWFAPCFGSGPWVQADLEAGLYESNEGHSLNTSNTGFPFPFVTAVEKNNGVSEFELRGGNAQSGALTTEYSGGLPTGYSPMHMEGAIVLGTGGDNSNSSIGSFFEGVVTSGFPADATENAVQENIVSVGYVM
jgi:hypothetical protein